MRSKFKKTKYLLPLFLLSFLVVFSSCATKEEKIEKYQKSAKEHIEKGKLKEAVLDLKNVIQLDPKNDVAHYDLGEVYVKLHNEADSFRFFVQAITINPDNMKAQLRVGQILYVAKKTREARKIANMILKQMPNNIEALLLLTGIQIQEKNLDSAMKTLKKAASIDPAHFKTNLFLAHLFFLKGNLDRAEESYYQAISSDRALRKPYIELTYLYGTKGEFDKAESLLKSMVQTPGQKLEKVTDLARFYESQKKWDQAENAYLKAVSFAANDDFTPLLNLGNYYVRRNSYGKALETLQKAIDVNANESKILITMAQLYFDIKKLDKAEIMVNRILKNDNKHPGANYLGGKLRLINMDFVKAMEHFNTVIVEDVNNSTAYYYRALCFLRKGGRQIPGQDLIRIAQGYDDLESWERGQAEENLLKAVELDSKLLDARLLLVELYLHERKSELARRHIQTALEQDPNYLRTLDLQVSLKIMKNDIAGAETVCKKILNKNPKYILGFIRLGLVYHFAKQNEKAIESFKKALELDPLQIEALEFMVGVYMQDKKYSEALKICEKHKRKTIENKYCMALIEYLEGKIFLGSGDTIKAKQYFKKSIEIDPNIIAPYETLASIYEQEKNIPLAIQQYEIIIVKKPEYFPAIMSLGRIYDFQNEKEKAENYYRKALKIRNGYVPALNNLAFNLAERGVKLAEALSLARLAKSKNPKNPDVMDTLGWLYHLNGRNLLAISELQDSLALNPDNPYANYHIGWAYYEKKEFEKAREYMAKALKLDPNFNGAEEARNILGN